MRCERRSRLAAIRGTLVVARTESGRQPATQTWRVAEPACQPSEIRVVRSRNRGSFSWEPLGVFGANMFGPFNQRAAIRYGRRPRHRKGAFILHRELELQVLATIARVPGSQGDLILPCVPFHTFFRGFVIEQPISFDHVQSLCVWRAKPVDHGNRPDLEPDCVYYQCVAFVVPDRIPIPGRRYVTGMGLVHAYVTDLMIIVIKDRDL